MARAEDLLLNRPVEAETPEATTPPAGAGTRHRPGVQALVDMIPAVLVLSGGWVHRWMDEDAFINLRIVDQIVAGHGPVFNAGERIEAFTSPLWLAILVLIKVTLGQVMAVEWAIVAVSLALAAAAFWLAARTTRRLHPDGTVVVPIGLVAIAAVPVVWDFATSGLEMSLVWLWLAGCWAVLVHLAQAVEPLRRGGRLGALMVLGLGPVIRPDLGLMTVVLVAAWLWMLRPAWLTVVADIAVAFALAIAYQVFRMGYYASVVPSTALAKDAGGLHLGQGWNYALDLSRPYHLWLPCCWGPAASRRRCSPARATFASPSAPWSSPPRPTPPTWWPSVATTCTAGCCCRRCSPSRCRPPPESRPGGHGAPATPGGARSAGPDS